MDRRRFALTLLATGVVTGLAACGRRGPLEPPLYTEQGKEFARRRGGNQQGQASANQTQTPGSVRQSLASDDAQRGTVDVESDVERNRSEGVPRPPSDPTQSEPAQTLPSVSPTGGGRRRPPGVIPPKRSFILDGLLE
ncbi:MAG: LPS translocon maturation chaperone LptM [Beijerinckiaceae bacterium]